MLTIKMLASEIHVRLAMNWKKFLWHVMWMYSMGLRQNSSHVNKYWRWPGLPIHLYLIVIHWMFGTQISVALSRDTGWYCISITMALTISGIYHLHTAIQNLWGQWFFHTKWVPKAGWKGMLYSWIQEQIWPFNLRCVKSIGSVPRMETVSNENSYRTIGGGSTPGSAVFMDVCKRRYWR